MYTVWLGSAGLGINWSIPHQKTTLMADREDITYTNMAAETEDIFNFNDPQFYLERHSHNHKHHYSYTIYWKTENSYKL